MILTNDHGALITYAVNLSTLSREFDRDEPAIRAARVRYDAERVNLSAQFAALRDLARADRADRVADRPTTATSLSFEAAHLGLVPHGEAASTGCCAPRIAILRHAATIISSEIASLPLIGKTVATAPAVLNPTSYRSAFDLASIAAARRA